jgi:hypothetical protein
MISGLTEYRLAGNPSTDRDLESNGDHNPLVFADGTRAVNAFTGAVRSADFPARLLRE